MCKTTQLPTRQANKWARDRDFSAATAKRLAAIACDVQGFEYVATGPGIAWNEVGTLALGSLNVGTIDDAGLVTWRAPYLTARTPTSVKSAWECDAREVERSFSPRLGDMTYA